MVNLKNPQTELVIAVIQIYEGKVRREDALPAQRKCQRSNAIGLVKVYSICTSNLVSHGIVVRKKRLTNTEISQNFVFKFTRVYHL